MEYCLWYTFLIPCIELSSVNWLHLGVFSIPKKFDNFVGTWLYAKRWICCGFQLYMRKPQVNLCSFWLVTRSSMKLIIQGSLLITFNVDTWIKSFVTSPARQIKNLLCCHNDASNDSGKHCKSSLTLASQNPCNI